MKSLQSILIWLYFVTLVIVFWILNLIGFTLTFWWDKNRTVAHAMHHAAAHFFIKTNPLIRIKVIRRFRPHKNKNYIFASNHQSMIDIVVCYVVGNSFKFVMKAGMLRIPILSMMVRMAGHIPVKRGDKLSGRKCIDACQNILNHHLSIMIFPEGTRTDTGELMSFKPGAAVLSVATHTPIVPVTIHGTKNLLSKGNWRLNRGTVTVIIDPPIDPKAFGDGNVDAITAALYHTIHTNLQSFNKTV